MPDINAETAGQIITPLGYDGSDFTNLTTDPDGHLQVDALTSPLPTGAATEAKQDVVIAALSALANLEAALVLFGANKMRVSVADSVLPDGAATSALQTTLNSLVTDLKAILNALGSVNTDDLQVDVKTSALPTGAATSAKQDTMITALQLIDDLRNALGSVNTDDLQVDVKTSALPSGAATEATLDALRDHVLIDPDWRYQGDNIVNVLGSVAVNSATWTDLCSYTVPAGTTAYIVGWSAGLYYANAMFSGDLQKAGTSVCYGDGYNSPLRYQGTVITKATAGQVVKVRGFHSVGTAQFMKGWINGWVQ
jgi:hypothetical protein